MKKLFAFCPQFLKIFSILIIFSIFESCSNDIDAMIDDYNSNFNKQSNSTVNDVGFSSLSPGDDGFDEAAMLEEKYDVRSDGTLNLYAPPKCASYKWSMTEIKKTTTTGLYGTTITSATESSVSFTLSNGSSSTSRAFILYVPTSGLSVGTYRISLSVTDEEGTEYKDSCILVIYFMSNDL